VNFAKNPGPIEYYIELSGFPTGNTTRCCHTEASGSLQLNCRRGHPSLALQAFVHKPEAQAKEITIDLQ
jgi:hypothetical protein